ncbi:hypothetical protein N7524_003789, partial [Penicillium chrysogenum]
MTRNSAETGRRRGNDAVRSGITVSFHRWHDGREKSAAVGYGRFPLWDSRRRQTTSGAAKPDWSPLNQNRGGWGLCHFRKSVDAKP